MQTSTIISSGHDSFVHDLSFDWYGHRLSTCSSDAKVKVWDRVGGSGSGGGWQCTCEIRVHSGSVLRVAWAHPEFGRVLASCSSDRSVHIYEEQVDGRTGARHWKRQGRLVDSRDAVHALEFAPRHLGLKIAAGALDGRIRIYESNDVSGNRKSKGKRN